MCVWYLKVDFYNSSINTVLITRRKLRFSVLKRPGTPPSPRRNGCSASHYTITEHNQFSTYGAFEHYFWIRKTRLTSKSELEAAFKISSIFFPLPRNFNFFMIDILTFQILPLLGILIHMMLCRLWGAISSKIPTRASQADAEICIWKRLKRPIFANLDSLKTPDSSWYWPSKPCQEQWLIQICFLLTSIVLALQ